MSEYSSEKDSVFNRGLAKGDIIDAITLIPGEERHLIAQRIIARYRDDLNPADIPNYIKRFYLKSDAMVSEYFDKAAKKISGGQQKK